MARGSMKNKTGPDVASSIKDQILQASPVLEPFGNACTVRNNNSSRFGKFIELRFKENGRVEGARILNFLLEKSRIVRQAEGERNYHVFYYLLKGCTEAERTDFSLLAPDKFKYLNRTGNEKIELETSDDAEEMAQLRTAMRVMRFTSSVQREIFRVLACVLHMGNVDFESSEE